MPNPYAENARKLVEYIREYKLGNQFFYQLQGKSLLESEPEKDRIHKILRAQAFVLLHVAELYNKNLVLPPCAHPEPPPVGLLVSLFVQNDLLQRLDHLMHWWPNDDDIPFCELSYGLALHSCLAQAMAEQNAEWLPGVDWKKKYS